MQKLVLLFGWREWEKRRIKQGCNVGQVSIWTNCILWKENQYQAGWDKYDGFVRKIWFFKATHKKC